MVIEPVTYLFLYELWSTLIIYLYALGSSINPHRPSYACIAINPTWILVQIHTLHDVYLIWLLEIAVLHLSNPAISSPLLPSNCLL